MFRSTASFFLLATIIISTSVQADIFAAVATIEGSVYRDANQNGIFDVGERGIASNVRMYSSSWGGPLIEMESGALTGVPGTYLFPVVKTGKAYFICIVLDSCSIQTQPTLSDTQGVPNMGPHGPSSGNPDEGEYCWEVLAPFANRRFGVYTSPCE